MNNPNCDGSGPHSGQPVRKLPIGGGGNAILCKACYQREIQFRKERNRELGNDAQFDLPEWESLSVHGEEN